jgi:hypothetical protein
MPTQAVGIKYPSGLTRLQVSLRDLSAVLETARTLDSRERTAFASIAVQMVTRQFAGELAVLEAERWTAEAAA